MGHTRPDWTTYGKLDQIFALYDLGELAVRLGSIVSYDRRGNVLWLDDFEDGLIKWKELIGVGVAPWDSATTKARNGGKSAYTSCSADTSPRAELSKGLPWRVAGKFGLEVSFATGANESQPYVKFQVYDGTQLYDFQIRFSTTNSLIQYRDADGNWQNLATGVNILKGDTYWHTLKLVIDSNEGEYIRVLFDGQDYSMAGIAGAVSASSIAPYLLITLANTTVGGVDSEIYYDDCIITQNED